MAADEDDPLVQTNVRLPLSVRKAADARRATLTDPATGRPLSRDKWITNAIRYALDAPKRPTTNTQRRTAPPPH